MLIFVVLVLQYHQPTTIPDDYLEQEQCMDFVRGARETDLQNPWVNKHEYTLLLNEDLICAADIFLLVTVLSAPENQETRQTIRNTYGTVDDYQGLSVRVIFLLGATANESSEYISPRIKQESDKYRDIIKGDFIDHYNNLTHKTVMGLHWFNKYCREAKFVLKIDDDTILNVYKAVSFLHDLGLSNKGVYNFFYCNVVIYARPQRNESKKWYLNYTEYPYTFQPDYCSGPGYLFSNDVGKALYKASTKVPFLFIEDVYVGFCAKLSGIPLSDHLFGFYMDTSREWFNWTSDWVVLLHLKNRDSKQWYHLWDNYFSSPAQHSINYYQVLKVCCVIIILYFVFICIYLIQKVNALALELLLKRQPKQKRYLPFV